MKNIKVVAFDADDTLWENEVNYRHTESLFCKMFGDIMPEDEITQLLYSYEKRNVPVFGYGVKSFVISMIETALDITDKKLGNSDLEKIIDLGRQLLTLPVVLLPGVTDVLEGMKQRHTLVLATKGDLLEQQTKVEKSGLVDYFHHVEIMSEKTSDAYRRLISRVACSPEEFLMIGNSMKSDIMPVIEMGGHGAFVPYHITWVHEHVEERHYPKERLIRLNSLSDVLNIKTL